MRCHLYSIQQYHTIVGPSSVDYLCSYSIISQLSQKTNLKTKDSSLGITQQTKLRHVWLKQDLCLVSITNVTLHVFTFHHSITQNVQHNNKSRTIIIILVDAKYAVWVFCYRILDTHIIRSYQHLMVMHTCCADDPELIQHSKIFKNDSSKICMHSCFSGPIKMNNIIIFWVLSFCVVHEKKANYCFRYYHTFHLPLYSMTNKHTSNK